MTATPTVPAGFDPTDPLLCEGSIPLEQFMELRKTAPVWWVSQDAGASAGFNDDGYWAVSKHADVAAVSKNSKDFSSQENGAIIRFSPDMTRDQVELQQIMLINQDPPVHTKTRQLISRGFTPRSIGALHDVLIGRANKIVDDALAKGEGDFVEDVAAELPLQAIADLLGVPFEDRRKLFDWSNQMLAGDDPEYGGQPDIAAAEILGYAMEMAADRKVNPRDDLITKLVQGDVDGQPLAEDEFGYFVIMLAVAGNETTRNAITHGMKAFFDHPDQWELFKQDRPKSATDEIIRWATPVTVFQRTALNDVMVGDQLVRKGQRVGIFYASGNNDEDVFDRPALLRRAPQPEPAPVLRRPRRALLHRRQPGPPRGRGDVQRDRRPDARDLADRRRRPAAPRLDQRHQAPPRQVRLTLAPVATCGSGGGRTFVAKLLHAGHRLAQLLQPVLAVLADEAHAPGQRVRPAAGDSCVDEGVEDQALALAQPGHHRHGQVGEHDAHRAALGPPGDLAAEPVLGLAGDRDPFVPGVLAEAGDAAMGRLCHLRSVRLALDALGRGEVAQHQDLLPVDGHLRRLR